MTIRPTNNFIRPKWGIYSSLLSSPDLRDEAVRFASFYISEAAVIPVELTSFTAVVTNSNVWLKWKTATELNNRGFEIQRKLEGSNWAAIGFRNGQGTKSDQTVYTFQDDISGIYNMRFYYRLKQLDHNGAYVYSNIIEVNIDRPAAYMLFHNYPNSFNPITTISYSIPTTGLVKLFVFNSLGEVIKELVNELKHAGNYNLSWNASDLNSGVYFLSMKVNDFASTQKMILMK